MPDNPKEFERTSELKFSREQGFFEKSIVIRIMIGITFSIALFLFLHCRQVRIEIPELNTIAPNYVVAQVDFDFLDEGETLIHKQEAVRDIGKIYKISEKEIRQRRIEFESYLITNQAWRDEAKHSTFNEMYKAIDAIEKTLIRTHFTDHRTYQKMRELKISVTDYLIYVPASISQQQILPAQVWEHVKALLPKDTNFSAETIEFILNNYQNNAWKLEEDIATQLAIRHEIQASVSDSYTHVSAGSRILDQGERVTSRHISILQSMKEVLNHQRHLWDLSTLLGTLLLTILFCSISYAFFAYSYPEVLESNRNFFLLVTILLLTLGIAKVTEYLFLSTKNQVSDVLSYPLFVPFAAILLCCLMNPGIALFASGFLTLLFTLALSFDQEGFLTMNIAAAMVAILSTRTLRQRKEIFVVCCKAWLCCFVVILAVHLYQAPFLNGLFTNLISSAVFMLLTGVTVVGLLPLLETAFGIMTDVTLMEYMDPNHDLLRRLSIEAPGTYQHSVVVGNLSEAAAQAIGANGLFCRVSTLYHDIGKMATPQYFTENQHDGMNIHQLLTPAESAQVIIAHISEGVTMARKAGLPEQFIDIIKEHHGTTLVYYFYQKQIEKMGGDVSLVDKSEFRYFGPKPRSKESAIIMIADSVEAASRCLDKYDEASIDRLSTQLIKEKMDDGQFDECLLTCQELAIVKNTLVKTLVAFSHARIKYPQRKGPCLKSNQASKLNPLVDDEKILAGAGDWG